MEVRENTVNLITCIVDNAITRIGGFPGQWKVTQIILIPKPGKNVTHVSSNRPISLLSVLSRLFEKLLLRKLSPIVGENNILHNHQFRRNLKDVRREQVLFSSISSGVIQTFDKVWHKQRRSETINVCMYMASAAKI